MPTPLTATPVPAARQRHVDHLAELGREIAHIRSMAATRQEWNALDERIKRTTEARGVTWTGGISKPSFYLHSRPDSTFYPYEPIWDAPATV